MVLIKVELKIPLSSSEAFCVSVEYPEKQELEELGATSVNNHKDKTFLIRWVLFI